MRQADFSARLAHTASFESTNIPNIDLLEEHASNQLDYFYTSDISPELELWTETLLRPRVLLVEEHYLQRALITTLLESENFHVVAVPSKKQAIRRLETQRFACVITDMGTDESEVKNFIAAVRNRKALADLPILILTSSVEHLEIPLLQAGADLVCSKKNLKKHLATQLRLVSN